TNGFRDKKYLIKRIRFNQITDDEIKDIICRCKWKNIKPEILEERDGFKSETFHKKCDGKGSTIVIIKLYDNDDLIDGYNPLDCESKNKFNIKNSFEEKAIGCRNSNSLMFGATDLYISSNYCNVKGSYYESVKMLDEYLMKSYEVLRIIKQR
ncbi:2396_t:CDS:2, partial [Gigaspora margarita]